MVPYIKVSLFLCILIYLPLFVQSSHYRLKNNNNIYLQTPTLSFGEQEFNLTTRIIITDLGDGCSSLKSDTGIEFPVEPFAILFERNGCYPQKKAYHAQEVGAIAVLIESYRVNLGLLKFYTDGKNHDDIHIPSLEISSEDARTLRDDLDDTLWYLLFPDLNPWDQIDFKLGWLFLSVVLGMYALAVGVLSLYKLINFIRSSEHAHTLPKIVLITQIGATLPRLVLALDPGVTRGILTWGALEFFFSITFSISLLINVLVAAFWVGAIPREYLGKILIRVRKVRYLCVIAAVVIVILDFVATIFMSFFIGGDILLPLKFVIYMPVTIIISLFYLFAGGKFLWMFRKTKNINKKGNLRWTTMWMIAGGVANIVCLITLMFLISPLYSTPVGFITLRILSHFDIYTVSLCEVAMFVSPRKHKEMSNSGVTFSQKDEQLSTDDQSFHDKQLFSDDQSSPEEQLSSDDQSSSDENN